MQWYFDISPALYSVSSQNLLLGICYIFLNILGQYYFTYLFFTLCFPSYFSHILITYRITFVTVPQFLNIIYFSVWEILWIFTHAHWFFPQSLSLLLRKSIYHLQYNDFISTISFKFLVKISLSVYSTHFPLTCCLFYYSFYHLLF